MFIEVQVFVNIITCFGCTVQLPATLNKSTIRKCLQVSDCFAKCPAYPTELLRHVEPSEANMAFVVT